LTDIARDGALTGPNLELLAKVASGVSIPIVASGGVSAQKDIDSISALESKGVEGMIVGKAIYEGRVDLAEAVRLTVIQ